MRTFVSERREHADRYRQPALRPPPVPRRRPPVGQRPQNRDSELAGFRPFKLIADHFAERGIAVLRFDDRGVGGSTGSIAESTTEDLGDDALAAVRTLRARRDIHGRRIGLVGHSEGAIVAAVAAARSPDVAFIVWLAGSTVSGAEILRMQAEGLSRGAGASPSAIEEILRHHDALMAAVKEHASVETLTSLARTLMAAQMGAVRRAPGAASGEPDPQAERLLAESVTMLQTPWMRYFVTLDPAAALRRVTCLCSRRSAAVTCRSRRPSIARGSRRP